MATGTVAAAVSQLTDIDDEVKAYLIRWGVAHYEEETGHLDADVNGPPPYGEWICTRFEGPRRCRVHVSRIDVPPGAFCGAWATTINGIQFSGNPRGLRYFRPPPPGTTQKKAYGIRIAGELIEPREVGLDNTHNLGSGQRRKEAGLTVDNQDAPARYFSTLDIARVMNIDMNGTAHGMLSLPWGSRDELAYKMGVDANAIISRIKHITKKGHPDSIRAKIVILLGLRLVSDAKNLADAMRRGMIIPPTIKQTSASTTKRAKPLKAIKPAKPAKRVKTITSDDTDQDDTSEAEAVDSSMLGEGTTCFDPRKGTYVTRKVDALGIAHMTTSPLQDEFEDFELFPRASSQNMAMSAAYAQLQGQVSLLQSQQVKLYAQIESIATRNMNLENALHSGREAMRATRRQLQTESKAERAKTAHQTTAHQMKDASAPMNILDSSFATPSFDGDVLMQEGFGLFPEQGFFSQ